MSRTTTMSIEFQTCLRELGRVEFFLTDIESFEFTQGLHASSPRYLHSAVSSFNLVLARRGRSVYTYTVVVARREIAITKYKTCNLFYRGSRKSVVFSKSFEMILHFNVGGFTSWKYHTRIHTFLSHILERNI